MKIITVDVARRYIDRFGGKIRANGPNSDAPEYLTDKYGSRIAMITKLYKTKKELNNKIKEINENKDNSFCTEFLN